MCLSHLSPSLSMDHNEGVQVGLQNTGLYRTATWSGVECLLSTLWLKQCDMSQIIYRLLLLVMFLSPLPLSDGAECLKATAERIRICLERNQLACLRTFQCEDIASRTSSCCKEDERLVVDQHSEVGHILRLLLLIISCPSVMPQSVSATLPVLVLKNSPIMAVVGPGEPRSLASLLKFSYLISTVMWAVPVSVSILRMVPVTNV